MTQLNLPLQFVRTIVCGNASNQYLEKDDGRPFRMRITICQGPKFIGKRVKIPLKTRDPHEAQLRRDAILSGLNQAGFIAERSEKILNKRNTQEG